MRMYPLNSMAALAGLYMAVDLKVSALKNVSKHTIALFHLNLVTSEMK